MAVSMDRLSSNLRQISTSSLEPILKPSVGHLKSSSLRNEGGLFERILIVVTNFLKTVKEALTLFAKRCISLVSPNRVFSKQECKPLALLAPAPVISTKSPQEVLSISAEAPTTTQVSPEPQKPSPEPDQKQPPLDLPITPPTLPNEPPLLTVSQPAPSCFSKTVATISSFFTKIARALSSDYSENVFENATEREEFEDANSYFAMARKESFTVGAVLIDGKRYLLEIWQLDEKENILPFKVYSIENAKVMVKECSDEEQPTSPVDEMTIAISNSEGKTYNLTAGNTKPEKADKTANCQVSEDRGSLKFHNIPIGERRYNLRVWPINSFNEKTYALSKQLRYIKLAIG